MSEQATAKAILITQCLQNDFVEPIGRYDPLPNLLHVGFAEARRLMGEQPSEGPVAQVMSWAQAQPEHRLLLVHIRDWHDPGSPAQRTHLERFGAHCIAGTHGAEFAFVEEPDRVGRVGGQARIIDSLTLNDFLGTSLEEVLRPYRDQALRVALIGVWTEAKITFLAYELATRYPSFELLTCSALTASSSRSQHFIALEQLKRLLGVRVLSSIGELVEHLGGVATEVPLPGAPASEQGPPQLEIQDAAQVAPADHALLRYLFRDCRQVRLKALDGGFSGNLVLGSKSVDRSGHQQVPHVVKIGPRDLIGRERASFERIEAVLGNSAPQVTDFADHGGRGAIKYRYASMGGGFSTTLQRQYAAGIPMAEVRRILHTVFVEQLGRFYAAATLETVDLFEYYQFDSRWAPSVRKKVEALLEGPAADETLTLDAGARVPNLCRFYEQDLAGLPRQPGSRSTMAYVHGDLNGANIIIDAQGNVWLIDFFHTHRGHVLRDLSKLENDLLYIFTPLADLDELRQAHALSDALLAVQDLGQSLPEAPPPEVSSAPLRRAYETVRVLRSFYPDLVKTDRDPLQLLIAQLRYAVHTLSFDESSPLQKRWALYTACRASERLSRRARASGRLRLDWLDARLTAPGRLAVTLLPGRRDYHRELAADLGVLVEEGVTRVVCLATLDELTRYGVERLADEYRRHGLGVVHLPMLDQKVCSEGEMRALTGNICGWLAEGRRVVVHCVGGLGRAGTVTACTLRGLGCSADQALGEVRRARSARAVESKVQEEMVRGFVAG